MLPHYFQEGFVRFGFFPVFLVESDFGQLQQLDHIHQSLFTVHTIVVLNWLFYRFLRHERG